MRVRSLVRSAVEGVLVTLPRRTGMGDRLVLAYHNVVPDGTPPRGDQSLHLPASRFAAQLRAVANEADIVPLMDLLTRAAPSERRVAITFDDAYVSALELGLAACVARGAPCTIFVAPGLLGTVPHWDLAAERGAWSDAERERFLWQEAGRVTDAARDSVHTPSATLRIATTEELRRASQSAAVTLGNHTMHHPNLGALATSEVCDELALADAWLRDFDPVRQIPVVAYPFGHAPRDPAAAVSSPIATHGLLVTGKWVHGDRTPPALSYPRWNVPAGVSARGFRARLRGWLAGR